MVRTDSTDQIYGCESCRFGEESKVQIRYDSINDMVTEEHVILEDIQKNKTYLLLAYTEYFTNPHTEIWELGKGYLSMYGVQWKPIIDDDSFQYISYPHITLQRVKNILLLR